MSSSSLKRSLTPNNGSSSLVPEKSPFNRDSALELRDLSPPPNLNVLTTSPSESTDTEASSFKVTSGTLDILKTVFPKKISVMSERKRNEIRSEYKHNSNTNKLKHKIISQRKITDFMVKVDCSGGYKTHLEPEALRGHDPDMKYDENSQGFIRPEGVLGSNAEKKMIHSRAKYLGDCMDGDKYELEQCGKEDFKILDSKGEAVRFGLKLEKKEGILEDVSKNEETGEDVLFSESFVCISPSRKKMNERVP